jgi:3-oxoacyl-[acyl-carrier-protein] synthase-3
LIDTHAHLEYPDFGGSLDDVPIGSGISRDKMFVNLDRYGNTSAAAVAIALDEANRTGRIKRGDYVLMVVFGGGLTWASTVIEW